MAQYLSRTSTQLTGAASNSATVGEATIIDTTTFPNQSQYNFATLNAIMVANKDTGSGHTVNFALISGGTTYALFYSIYINVGQTFTTKPEAFLNLLKGDKVIAWSTDVGQFMDIHASYLYVDNT